MNWPLQLCFLPCPPCSLCSSNACWLPCGFSKVRRMLLTTGPLHFLFTLSRMLFFLLQVCLNIIFSERPLTIPSNITPHIYVCVCVYIYSAAAKSLQSCPTLCDPIDGSPLGSSVPGICQARTLEWVAISFSNAWKWKVKVKSLSRVRLFATPWTEEPTRLLRPWDFPGKSTGVGCHCLLWYIYSTSVEKD